MWYHTLNAALRSRISGETDFPCIYGERVGLGRVYVKLADGTLDFDRWTEGVKDGRSYVSDGYASATESPSFGYVHGNEPAETTTCDGASSSCPSTRAKA